MWIVMVASLVGTVANIYKKRWGFGVWLVTNAAWVWHNLLIREYPQAALFLVYTGLAVWGLVRWNREGRDDRRKTRKEKGIGEETC